MTDEKKGDELVQKLEELGKKKAAEPPPELTDEVVFNLAGMTPLEYAQKIGREAKKHRVPMSLLEKAVDAARTELASETLLEPHWAVQPANDPVDAAELFAEIEARILQHVVMPKDLAFVVALWVGQSWIHQHGTYSPILGVTSAERDSGKSTLMGVIAFLVRRSLLSVGVSAAALYRSIEKWNPTFVVDEADDAFVDNPDLRQVINSGWTRGQGVMRCDPDTNEPRRFSTFCPKVIALKGKKMPDTMLSRTIFIEMKRRLRSEKVDHFRHLDDAGFARMRSQLARWAQDSGEALGLAQAAQPEGFMNRTASNWQLMFAIADSLGEEAGARARTIAQHIAGVTDMASAGVALLQDIKTMFEASTLDYVYSRKLLDHLHADPEKPWVEYGRAGKPISEKGVAGLLHEYRIVSRNVGPRAAQRTKGYRKADFEDAWARYLTPEAEKAEGGLDSDILPSTRPPPCNDYGKAEKSAVHQPPGGRQKIDPFPSEINAVDGWTADSTPSPPSSSSTSGGDFPDFLRRPPVPCNRCGKPATPTEPVGLCGQNGSAGPYHQRCWTEERTKGRVQPQEVGEPEPVCRRCGVPGNATHGQLIRAAQDGCAGHFHPCCWSEERTKGPWRQQGASDLDERTKGRSLTPGELRDLAERAIAQLV
jgi:hypothetical protein